MLELFRNREVVITTTNTGYEAYNLLKSDTFDCMVLDLGITDISGVDLLEKIQSDHEIDHRCPIIVYSGKELTKEEELRLKKHAETIIIKGGKSHERLLDEITLFLHRVGTEKKDRTSEAG